MKVQNKFKNQINRILIIVDKKECTKMIKLLKNSNPHRRIIA